MALRRAFLSEIGILFPFNFTNKKITTSSVVVPSLFIIKHAVAFACQCNINGKNFLEPQYYC